MIADWTAFRLCFAAALGVKRTAGWICFHDGAWWVKRHLCDDPDESAPWVQAKTRSGCVRYLARWVLLDIKKTGDTDAADPSWPRQVVKRAKRALELHGDISAMLAEGGRGFDADRRLLDDLQPEPLVALPREVLPRVAPGPRTDEAV